MLNIGPAELVVILIAGLLILGPKKLPEAARQVGKAVAEFRRVSSGFQAEMRDALYSDPDPLPPKKLAEAGQPEEAAPSEEEPVPLPPPPEATTEAELRSPPEDPSRN